MKLKEEIRNKLHDKLLAIKIFYNKTPNDGFDAWYDYATEKDFKYYEQRVEKKYNEIESKSKK